MKKSTTITLPFCFAQDQITFELPEPPSENKAVVYFFVTPDTGVLHLKEDLQNDGERDTQYQVISHLLSMALFWALCKKFFLWCSGSWSRHVNSGRMFCFCHTVVRFSSPKNNSTIQKKIVFVTVHRKSERQPSA